ncbi:hypothetical protein BpHYR1_044674 [Brachionus plicatilis]|uniref:Uncharacterized protein n=1 Tax=Brachionus plicatilis TaxID=10195 RepID=A0A3M7T2C0_BRAPC|nr:hypothetical protein BpHYR1_044674 [Brachionus plicatilis]
MSRELVPLRKLIDFERTPDNQNKFDLVWSFASNNLNLNVQFLHEEKNQLENQLKSKLTYRQNASTELETQLKQVNVLASECDKIKNFCETECQKKTLLEKDHQTLLNELNQEEERISVCEKQVDKLKEDYLIEMKRMTKTLQLKNNLLADIITSKAKTIDEEIIDKKLIACDQEIGILEQDIFLLKDELDQLKNIEKIWQRINSDQVNYFLSLLENEASN